MPSCARREIVDPNFVGVYHCISRCVRRALLCGDDPVSGRNYDHRKGWIEERIRELVGVFAMEVLSSSVMDNHMHQEIRTRPDLAKLWSDEEVVRRWWRIYPARKDEDGSPSEMNDRDLAMMLSDAERVAELRRRLSSLSWFMKELKEPIARQANREDEVTGHFWNCPMSCVAPLHLTKLGSAGDVACEAQFSADSRGTGAGVRNSSGGLGRPWPV
jgi:hypothetical protein